MSRALCQTSGMQGQGILNLSVEDSCMQHEWDCHRESSNAKVASTFDIEVDAQLFVGTGFDKSTSNPLCDDRPVWFAGMGYEALHIFA